MSSPPDVSPTSLPSTACTPNSDRAATTPIRRWAIALALLLILTGAASACYWQLYSSFAAYDDEGYVLLSLRTFQAGHPLYDETFTQYGPAYFLVQDALHRLLRLPVTHDVARLKTLLVWLAAAMLAAVIALRLTDERRTASARFSGIRWTLALTVGLGTLWHLDRLGLEPGHPQDQALCLLLGVLLWSLREPVSNGGQRWRAVGLGVLTGLLAMTKLNLGVLTGLACAGALLLDASQRPTRAWLWWGVVLAGMALPLTLAGTRVLTWGGSALPAVVLAGWCGVMLVSRQPSVTSPEPASIQPFVRWLVAAGLTAGLLAVWTLGQGTSLAGLWQGLVGQHRGFLDLFYHDPPLPRAALCAAALGVLLAAWGRRDARAVHAAQWLSLALLLTAGLHVFCESLRPVRHGLDDRAAAGWLAACVLPISWALLAGGDSSFARRMLCLLTITQPLAAFPTPGTQLAIGTLPALLTVAVLSGDLLHRLRAEAAAAGPSVALALRGLAAVALLSLACRDVAAWRTWSAATPLALPGAHWLRLPAEEAASRRRVVEYLRSHTDSFVASPTGCCSFYLWAGLTPPTTRNVTFWEVLLSDREQRDVIAALERAPRSCVVEDRRQTPVRFVSAPLHRYLQERYSHTAIDGLFAVRIPPVPPVSAQRAGMAVE